MYIFITLCFAVNTCVMYNLFVETKATDKRNLLFPNPDNCGIFVGDLGIWPEIGYKSIAGMTQRLLRCSCTLHQHPILTFPRRGNAAYKRAEALAPFFLSLTPPPLPSVLRAGQRVLLITAR